MLEWVQKMKRIQNVPWVQEIEGLQDVGMGTRKLNGSRKIERIPDNIMGTGNWIGYRILECVQEMEAFQYLGIHIGKWKEYRMLSWVQDRNSFRMLE